MQRCSTIFVLSIAVAAAVAGNDPPVTQPAPDLAKYDAQIKPADRLHWSFQPIKKPAVPTLPSLPLVQGAAKRSWARNPIDAFVLAGLAEQGWQPAPPVAPRVLIRRLYFDLIGLPPTPEEIEEFISAYSSPGTSRAHKAYENLVDRLLASPHYGERWGRHWLDVVRYAETNGYERDAVKPNIWRYRDYVIRAFNQDKPFDEFILEQLAGDELDALPSPHR